MGLFYVISDPSDLRIGFCKLHRLTMDLSRSAVNLTIRNRLGSVEHYYHFLLGFLFPLAVIQSFLNSDGLSGPIYVRDCGPMDRILGEIGFPRVRMVDRHEHHLNTGRTIIDGWNLIQMTASGFDFTNGNYPGNWILKAKEIVRSQLSDRIVVSPKRVSSDLSSQKKNVLLINRSIDPFYSSGKAERPTSGLQRRSIRNFDEVENALHHVCDDINSVVLEKSTLAEQISLFESSDIVIAQHGASLANVVWCKPNTRIIEIAPIGYRVKCFPPLSKLLGLDHRLTPQKEEHGDCDISDLISNVVQ